MKMHFRHWVENNSLAIVIIFVVTFFVATIPASLPDIFARSTVSKLSDHGIQISKRSLVASRPASTILDSNVFRNGVFSIEFVSQADISNLGRISSIISYSKGLPHNWGIEQHGTTLVVLYKSNTARFRDAFRTADAQHFIVQIDPLEVRLYRAGINEGSVRWSGTATRWALESRLSIGNEDTGDYPWIGRLELLRIYDHGLDDEDASNLYRAYSSAIMNNAARLSLTVSGDSSFLLTSGRDGVAIPLDIYEWPWTLKLRRVFEVSPLHFDVQDILLNLFLTTFFGFSMAAHFRGRSVAVVHSIVIATALGLSLFAETMQLFSPSRVTSMVDVAMNTLGAFIGSIIWHSASSDSTAAFPET
jgi:hypothetical protein